MFLLALAAGLALGWLARGSLRHLGHLPLRGLGLVALAAVLRLAVERGALPGPWLPWMFPAAHLVLLGTALANLRVAGMGLLAAGTLLNLAVIAANGGRMPVSPEAVTALAGTPGLARLARGDDPVHVLLTPGARLPYLADVLFLIPAPFLGVFSAGDLLAAAGLARAVQAGMRPPAR